MNTFFLHKQAKRIYYIYFIVFILLFKDVIPILQNSVVQAICLGSIFLLNFTQKEGTIRVIIWYGIFALVSIYSCLLNDKINLVLTLINTFLYVSNLAFLYKEKEDLYIISNAFSLFGSILFAYLLIEYSSILGYGRLGDHMENTTYGSSIQFSYYIIAIILSSFIALLNNEKTATPFKIISVICIVLGFTIAMFNGAKKAYITPLFFIMVYTFVRNKSNILKLVLRIGLLILIVAVIWNKVKNIELLQQNFVYRMEVMISVLSSDNDVDTEGSTADRLSFIPIALDTFANSPIWGLGGLGFSGPYFMKVIKVNHPHNDFLNLLAAGGIILFFIYYWLPIKILIISYKVLSRNAGTAIMFTLLVTLLFNNLNSSTYNIPVINIFYVLVYKYLIINKYYAKNSYCRK